MSFHYPDDPYTLADSLLSGLQVGEDGTITGDLSGFASLWADQNTALEDYTAAQATALATGTLDGAGAAVLAHGITSAFGLVLVQAWCKGASVDQFLPCTIASVDATNVNVTGGVAGRAVRAFVMYSIVPPGW